MKFFTGPLMSVNHVQPAASSYGGSGGTGTKLAAGCPSVVLFIVSPL